MASLRVNLFWNAFLSLLAMVVSVGVVLGLLITGTVMVIAGNWWGIAILAGVIFGVVAFFAYMITLASDG